ncbi:MAG: efflux RND transporter permease subunit [Planctomycetota bacterium]
MSLPRLSVRNPVAVNLLMWLIVIGGVWAWQVLIREFFPTIAPEAITITVPVPGAPPDEIEELVTRRIELEVNDLDGVDEVTSRVLEGLSVTTLKLDHGIDAESLLNDVRTRVDRAETDLPSSAEDAIVNEVRPVLPVASIVVFGSAGELKLREAARKVRDDLRASNTISRIGMSGVRDRELHIEVQPSQLERHGLTFGEVGQIVAASNLDVAGGQLKGPLGNVRVRTLGEDEDPVHLEGLAIRAGPGGASVLLRDLGTVKSTF